MKIILIRTSLILVIVTGVTVSGIQMIQLKKKLTTFRAAAIAQTTAREKAETDLAILRREADKNALVLKQTADALATKNAETIAQSEQIAKLNRESEKLRHERDDAQDELAAYRVSMPSPEQVAHAARRIKELEDSMAASDEEKALLLRQVKKLTSLLPDVDGSHPIELPACLNPKGLAVDPKWRFVVLDAGEDQGVLAHGELLLSRSGKLVARVLVRSVERNRCVADLMAGWDLVEVMEGDRAIPAYPHS
jgi:hypothetical protein